jgi:hypothetical protein
MCPELSKVYIGAYEPGVWTTRMCSIPEPGELKRSTGLDVSIRAANGLLL